MKYSEIINEASSTVTLPVNVSKYDPESDDLKIKRVMMTFRTQDISAAIEMLMNPNADAETLATVADYFTPYVANYQQLAKKVKF